MFATVLRREEQGDDRYRNDREDRVESRALPEKASNTGDRDAVRQRDECGEAAVHNRPTDDQVNRIEAVAEDRDGDRERHEQT